MEQIVITPENINQVQFKGIELTTELSTSFDAKAKEAKESETVVISVNMDNASLEDVLQRALSDRRITINATLKGNAYDSKSYVKFIQESGNEFTYTWGEIGGRAKVSEETKLLQLLQKMPDNVRESTLAEAHEKGLL